jgi:hypothetical protein
MLGTNRVAIVDTVSWRALPQEGQRSATIDERCATAAPHRLASCRAGTEGPSAAIVRKAAHPSLEYETGHAEALVGDHLSVTNQRVEFQRRLTDGEIARLRLKAGEVKRFE